MIASLYVCEIKIYWAAYAAKNYNYTQAKIVEILLQDVNVRKINLWAFVGSFN